MTETREEAARRLAEAMGWELRHDRDDAFFATVPGDPNELQGFIGVPDNNAPLHEKLAFTGQLAESVFPHEDDVFRCGWVHGVLENCIEDARVKYDLCYAAMLAAAEAKAGPR